MTTKFGIEIEFQGLGYCESAANHLNDAGFPCRSEGYNHDVRNYWKVTDDGSVSRGCELVSPPLPFDLHGLANVSAAFAAINAKGGSADSSCGLHVHVDCTFVRSYSPAKKDAYFEFLLGAFQKAENSFDLMVQDRRVDGYSAERWCKSTKGKTVRRVWADRYHKLNLVPFDRQNTVEFRQMHGTVNGKAAIAWITLVVRFMENVKARFEACYDAQTVETTTARVA